MMPIGRNIVALWPQAGGPLLVLAAAVAFEALRRFDIQIPNPPAILVLLVAYSAFRGGYAPGFFSAALALAYIAWFFSVPGRAFEYSHENLVRVLVWAVSVPLMVWMMGRLKRQLVRHAEQHLQAIEAAPNGMLMVDRQGRIVLLNTQIEKLFGYARAELIGQPVERLVPERVRAAHPGLRDGFFADPRSRAMGTGRDLFGLRKDGSEVPVEIGLNPVGTGEDAFVLASVIDITERKQVEEALRQAQVKLETRVRERTADLSSANRSLRDEIALRSQTEAALKGDQEVLGMIAAGGPLLAILETMARHIEARSSGALCSILLLDPDGLHLRHGAAPSLPEAYNRAIDGVAIGPSVGSCGTAAYLRKQVIVADIAVDPLWADFSVLALQHDLRACWSTPILSTDGRVLGTFAMYSRTPRSPAPSDLATIEQATYLASIAIERKQAQDALLRANQGLEFKVAERTAELEVAKERAESSDRLKSSFLATMSHELRTPLNSIIGFTGILLQGLAGPLNPEQAKQLGMVRDSARHLLALINDVLDISKIEAGELRVDREPFELRAAIDKALFIVKPLAEKKGLALRAELAPALGAATGDARRVAQVLLNLLNNAIKFTEQGEVALSAALEGDSVQIRIADTGIGIKPEDLTTLFQPFRQVDDGLARNHEGTGLGLAICRRLAELMGGEIRAESEWGKGSSFTFTLPIEGPRTP